MHRVLRRGWEAPSENPVRTRGAQDQSDIRAAFSLDTFFWRSKRKYLGCRAETRLTKNCRDSDTNPNNPASNRNFGVILFIVQVQNTITQAIFSTIPLQNSIHRAPDRTIGVILSNDQAQSSTNRENFFIVRARNSIIRAIFSTIPVQNSIHQARNRTVGVILSNARASSSNDGENYSNVQAFF
ncbi:hypothetical protein EDE11_12247 [Methylomonas methanica]|uniref:Uncharacterized protein n=2 Tax=Methylomonas TaxID=416 RepID=A0A140E599_9GAMM|nr:hypothetical protein JT25_003570 [Methylomonas denitrificans]OAI09190.1 hypothetical protein A1342_08325 [Methylomonas methanica]TCV79070.1 hypothetical protein EDE11_12247 [Methylomonas methanica]